ncbi:MAG: apolipoprotein N-acyltransferase [Bacteroidota bacterium]
MLQRLPNYLLALISGLLLSASWFEPFTFLIFFAWIPLLVIEDKISNSTSASRKRLKLTGLSYLTFFTWNICVTWWIYYASLEGACMAIICNAILMCVVFMIWHNLKRRLNKPWTIWLLIPLWLGFEYGHTLWDLTWTWLTLGNVFANTHNWVQWYEFTGTSGGSLWILAVNILFFNLLKNNSYNLKQFLKPVLVIIIPLALSYYILFTFSLPKNEKTYKTLVVQPNVDPYNDKFYTAPEIQLHLMLEQVHGVLDSTVDFLVLPETFLTENIFEGKQNESFSYNFLKDSILKMYPHLTIISGANTMYVYKHDEKRSATARKFGDVEEYFESYNTGMQLNNEGVTFYHKSKLVPGVEKMPFPALFKPFESLAIDLGGTMGSLGTQDERTVFFNHDKKVGIAPVICYESVYPDYVGQYVRNGANLIFIITNDGWWENTPGHKQHLAYAKLRAIETRREIARCANTGISCFITPLGEIEQATPYWKEALIKKDMSPNNTMTLFVRFGDLISYAASIMAILLFIWSQVLRFKKS